MGSAPATESLETAYQASALGMLIGQALGSVLKAVQEAGAAISAARGAKPSLSAHKQALKKVHGEVGGPLPKGQPGKFGSPQAGDSKKGYRLDPPHDGAGKGDAEAKYHFNWWDYTQGKRGRGGRSGAIPIED
jgi:hypothetical protein